jgi:hypothetical protein
MRIIKGQKSVQRRLHFQQGKVELQRDKNIQSLFSQAHAFTNIF